ncbi:MAG: KPN_02809 family neutral zinc metallopeptidase [Hyphomicrobiaceae bacterium]
MRYDKSDRESRNVEDRRGRGGGLGGMFPFPGRRRGGRGIQIPFPTGRSRGARGGGLSLMSLLIIGGIMLLFGINPLSILTGGGGGGGGGGVNLPDFNKVPQMPKLDRSPQPRGSGNPFEIPGLPGSTGKAPSGGTDELATFTKRVLADTEDVWNRVFKTFGRQYREPKLVLYSGLTQTACGTGQSAMGPFYCPLDQKIYVDLRFYEELRRKFRAPGDFAQAYVVAHEVGHHVQTLLGIASKVQEMKQRHPRAANQIQVRMELQADCLAGVWANLNDQLKDRLEPGDIEEGLNAASAIGDDMIQRRTTGRVVPDAFTHGSSEQRVRWFRMGFDSGRMQDCDTFNSERL